jgi:hypothetical protein
MNKKQPAIGSKSELYGALLEDRGPASALSSWVDTRPIPFRSRRLIKTGNPSVKLFQVMSPVPHALRVNDASERRPFLQFLARSFHRRHDFAPRQDQFLAKHKRGVARFAETTSRLMRSLWARVRFFADDFPASNSRTCSAAARSQ